MTWHRLLPVLQALAGAACLVWAAARCRALRSAVPEALRGRWLVLTRLIYFFLLGYAAFVAAVASGAAFPVELVTGSVFLGGAVFVYLVIDLSRTTVGRLRTAERDWQESFDIIDEAITIHDTEFHILRANRAARQLFGEGFRLEPGTECYRAYHGTPCAPAGCPSCETSRTGRAAEQEVWEPHLGRHLSIRSLPRFDADGTVGGVVHVVADISDRKRREAQLEESEQRYRELIERTEDWVVRTDGGGRITFLNRAALDGLGLPANRCLGRPLIEFVHPDDRGQVQERLGQWVRELPPRAFLEIRMVSPEGHERHLQWALHFDRRGRRLEGGSGIGRDLTERVCAEAELRELEEQLYHAQKLEAVGTLAGGIAHDFNNLLQVIEGFTEMLREDTEAAGGDTANLDRIARATRRGSELVQGLLAFSRKDESCLDPLDLNSEVQGAAEMLARTLPKMVAIELELAPELRPIRADARRIGQVLMNLGTNAGDAMPDGGTLTLSTANVRVTDTDRAGETDGQPGEYVVLRVTDTGVGMTEEVRRQVFEPFYTTKNVGEGTGLGLSTVYGIVGSHGGRIRCESTPDRGTTFSVWFPVDAEAAASTPEPEAPEAPAGGRERLLLVDDEEDVREVGKLGLERLGYTVETADSGEGALRRLEGDAVDLVILDLGMPGMGGRACLKQLAVSHPALPVLVASGYAHTSLADGVLEAGARAFVAKPYRVQDLAAQVRNLLDAAP